MHFASECIHWITTFFVYFQFAYEWNTLKMQRTKLYSPCKYSFAHSLNRDVRWNVEFRKFKKKLRIVEPFGEAFQFGLDATWTKLHIIFCYHISVCHCVFFFWFCSHIHCWLRQNLWNEWWILSVKPGLNKSDKKNIKPKGSAVAEAYVKPS